jgi:hypothetical protein
MGRYQAIGKIVLEIPQPLAIRGAFPAVGAVNTPQIA